MDLLDDRYRSEVVEPCTYISGKSSADRCAGVYRGISMLDCDLPPAGDSRLEGALRSATTPILKAWQCSSGWPRGQGKTWDDGCENEILQEKRRRSCSSKKIFSQLFEEEKERSKAI